MASGSAKPYIEQVEEVLPEMKAQMVDKTSGPSPSPFTKPIEAQSEAAYAQGAFGKAAAAVAQAKGRTAAEDVDRDTPTSTSYDELKISEALHSAAEQAAHDLEAQGSPYGVQRPRNVSSRLQSAAEQQGSMMEQEAAREAFFSSEAHPPL
jgi:hypothetical protein